MRKKRRRRRRRRTLLWATPKKTLIRGETWMLTSLALLKLLAFKLAIFFSFFCVVNRPYYRP